MRQLAALAIGLAVLVIHPSCARQSGTLQAAIDALGADGLHAIEYSGSGRWYQFGQAPNPTLPWPPFDVSSFTATVDYDTPSARVQMVRRQVVEPGRVRPAPVEQRPVQVVSGRYAWNAAGPAGSAPANEPAPQAQPSAVAERTMEIWSTPHGFLRAAASHHATSRPVDGGSEISFTMDGKYRYVGLINPRNQVDRIRTWIDNPVLGDMPVETAYSEYRDFGGVMFPARIARRQGGHPVLDLTITSVGANPVVHAQVPERVRVAAPAAGVDVERLAAGVHYLRGGSHHSVAIEQRDHIVVVEAPLDEERSETVIAKVKELIPNKPIRYVINTHAHFDHSGGLRTYVAEGATVVTHEMNKPYYEAAWSAPRTIVPDRLSRAGGAVTFETVSEKGVLTDGVRPIEIHHIAASGHDDAFLMVYLPIERILIEADAFTPAPANAPPPATPNPYWVNLYDNIERLKLQVRRIAALHGPRVSTMADLRDAIGVAPQRSGDQGSRLSSEVRGPRPASSPPQR